MEKQNNIVYQIINKETGHFYIGAHSTDKVDDTYQGSGGAKYQRHIEKYGVDNLRFFVIANYKTREEALTKESQLLDHDMLVNPLCLNTNPGKDSYNVNNISQYLVTAKDCISKASRIRSKIVQKDRYGNYIKTWNSQNEAAKTLDIKQSYISVAVNTNTKAYSCYWERLKEE